jgi:hypothetical protein
VGVHTVFFVVYCKMVLLDVRAAPTSFVDDFAAMDARFNRESRFLVRHPLPGSSSSSSSSSLHNCKGVPDVSTCSPHHATQETSIQQAEER